MSSTVTFHAEPSGLVKWRANEKSSQFGSRLLSLPRAFQLAQSRSMLQ